MQLIDFMNRHQESEFRHKEELFDAITSGLCRLERGPSSKVAAQQLHDIYSGRIQHLRRYTSDHALTLLMDCQELVQSLENSIDQTVASWRFESKFYGFVMFESNPTGTILVCLRTVDRRKVSSEDWDRLWGR